MQVDIYIREINGNREIRIPWLPDEIPFETGEASMASYDILNKGPVEIPTGVGLAVYSWESIFPGKNRTDTSMMRGSWKKPSTYHDILTDWKEKGTKLNLLVTGYPINKTVYITKYDGNLSGAFGDINYTVSFKEARNILVTSTKVTVKKRTTTQARTTEETTTYVVKSGDTLWEIAEKKLGSGLEWKTIYNANKSIIESTAKSRNGRGSNYGHWIFPGTKLSLKN